MMLIIWVFFVYCVFFLGASWLFARAFLSGADLSIYDGPGAERVPVSETVSPENAEVYTLVRELRREIDAVPMASRIGKSRELLDAGIARTPVDPVSLGVTRIEVDAGGVAAEWILAPASDPDRRLLYLHGGAFSIGSPSSHRYITAAIARLAGVSVLSLDYRLMPEHSRLACVLDCQMAYRWMLDNGPPGASKAADVYVAGDSAGGNLALVLIAWIRDTGLRQVDAAIALSPATDSTFASPSLRANRASDAFLGPTLGQLMRLPAWLLSYFTLLTSRARPGNPVISPLRGDLSRLPPTLVQASDCEMLLDDARRYVNKASAAGSPAELQVWTGMVHVWQLFLPLLPEARDALQRIAEFIRAHPGPR